MMIDQHRLELQLQIEDNKRRKEIERQKEIEEERREIARLVKFTYLCSQVTELKFLPSKKPFFFRNEAGWNCWVLNDWVEKQ